MEEVLLIPGDGYGPSLIDAAERVLRAATDRVEAVRGDAGFSAYERTGEYLPAETMELAKAHSNIICGPTRTYKDPNGRECRPLEELKSALDVFAVVRTFRSLAPDLGQQGMEVTLWGSNLVHGSDVVETRDLDGITISKYIRSSSYGRMMARALADMELSGKDRVVCVTQDTIFPESSALFSEAFDAVFDPGAYHVGRSNVQYWASKVVRKPTEYDYVVCADLYSSVAAGILAGMVGGNRLFPITYVGEYGNVIVPGLYTTFDEVPKGYANPTSAIQGVVTALHNMGMRDEAASVLCALRGTYAAGERTPDAGGDLTTEQFADRVVSRLRRPHNNYYGPGSSLVRECYR